MGDNTKKVWKENGKWHSKEHQAEYMRQWREHNPHVADDAEKATKAAYMREWNARHKDRVYSYARKRLDRYKEAVFAVIGNVCARCGFADKRALQIDHKEGGGVKHLTSLGWSRTKFYKEVLNRPNDFQTLCANCNWIKRFECGEGTGFGAKARNQSKVE